MILDDIVKAKQKELKELPPLNFLQRAASNVTPPLEFPDKAKGFFVIAEVKKASPSKGVFREDFDPVALAKAYQKGGAAAISVVTERNYFQGHLDYIRRIKTEVNLPVLRKDFITEEAQIYESRIAGADAILLIAAILDDAKLTKFVEVVKSLKMRCVVEVHTEQEAQRALKTKAEIIGINNRDLKTFKVDIRTTLGIVKKVAELKNKTVIAESGIKSKQEIEVLRANGVTGVLIGETLIKAEDPTAKLREMLA